MDLSRTALQRTGAKVIGVVLTLVKKDSNPYDYYYAYNQGARKPKNLGHQLKLKRKNDRKIKKTTV